MASLRVLRGTERRGARYGSPQGRSGMLLIICYASWRVTRATRQRAAGEIETGATGSYRERIRDRRENWRGRRNREGKIECVCVCVCERERGESRARDPYSDALRSIEDEQHDFELWPWASAVHVSASDVRIIGFRWSFAKLESGECFYGTRPSSERARGCRLLQWPCRVRCIYVALYQFYTCHTIFT